MERVVYSHFSQKNAADLDAAAEEVKAEREPEQL